MTGRRYVYVKGGCSDREASRAETITWDEFIAEYVASRVRLGRTEKHVYDIKNTLTRFGRTFEDQCVAPHMMQRRILNAALDDYRAQGKSDQTVQHAAVKIMAAYTWAVEEEIFSSDKLANFRKPPIRDRKKHESVSLEEIGRIIRAVAESWSPDQAPASRFRSEEARGFFKASDTCMTLWLPETGMRIGETCKATLDALDLEARTVQLTSTKNGDDRVAFLTEDFVNGPLAEWLAIRNGLEAMTNRLFINELGLPLAPYAWGRGWNKYVKRAGIERRIRRHDLRHFSSTAHDRVDRELSKKIIGHHTDAAHAIYSHRELHELRAAHDAADPIGPLLAQVRADAEARQAAAEPKTVRRKVYTKTTRGQG